MNRIAHYCFCKEENEKHSQFNSRVLCYAIAANSQGRKNISSRHAYGYCTCFKETQ